MRFALIGLICAALAGAGHLQQEKTGSESTDPNPTPPAPPEKTQPPSAERIDVIQLRGTEALFDGKPSDLNDIVDNLQGSAVRIEATRDTPFNQVSQLLEQLRSNGVKVVSVGQGGKDGKQQQDRTRRTVRVANLHLQGVVGRQLPEHWVKSGVTGITVAGDQVTLWGTEEGVQQVGNLLESLDKTNNTDLKPDDTWTVFHLKNILADQAGATLEKLMPEADVVAQPNINGLFVRGDERTVKQIENMLKMLDGPPRSAPAPSGPPMRPDPNASASVRAVQELLAAGEFARARAMSNRLAQDARNAAGNPVLSEKNELKALVREDFEVRQQMQLAEIRFLREKLEALERRVHQQQALKDQLIDRRVRELQSAPTKGRNRPRTSRKPSAATPPPSEPYIVRAGDTLGFFIPHVLGKPEESPPIHRDPTGQRPPALGYPITIRGDGSASFPILGDVKLAGKTLKQIEETMKQATAEVVRQPMVLVSLIRRVDERVDPVVIAPQNTASTAAPSGGTGMPTMRSASEFASRIVDLQDQMVLSRRRIKASEGDDSAVRIYQDKLNRLQLQYDTLLAEFDLQQEMIKSSLNAAVVDLESTKADYSRNAQMVKKGYVSATELSQAKAKLAQAESQVNQLQGLLGLYHKVRPDAVKDAIKRDPESGNGNNENR